MGEPRVRTLFFRHEGQAVRFSYKDGAEQIFWFSPVNYFELEREQVNPWAVLDLRDLPPPYCETIKSAWADLLGNPRKTKWKELRAVQKATLIAFFEAGGNLLHECRRQWMTRHPAYLPAHQQEIYAVMAARGGMFVADAPRARPHPPAPVTLSEDDDDFPF